MVKAKVVNKILKLHSNMKNNYMSEGNIIEHYNCWAFISYLFGWIDGLHWIYEDEIDDYLETYTIRVFGDPEPGDIAAGYSDQGIILHTGLMVKGGMILHKPGGGALDFETFHQGMNRRYWPETVEYRRVV